MHILKSPVPFKAELHEHSSPIKTVHGAYNVHTKRPSTTHYMIPHTPACVTLIFQNRSMRVA